jgi:hypothetical protein
MYSRCIFCQVELGRNEAIEHFLVGRRLAFDAAKGRLWVVCRACERWNLTPLEERWEAIEECERAFRDNRLRVSTDNIGLCRLADGTELVRIGEPQRPEMAAWRYGDQFGRRRRRFLVISSAATLLPLGLSAAELFGRSGAIGVVGSLALTAWSLVSTYLNHRGVARVRTADRVIPLSTMSVRAVVLRGSRDHWWELDVPDGPNRNPFPVWRRREQPIVSLHGDSALAAARVALPLLNNAGGKATVVRDAVARLDGNADVGLAFARAAAAAGNRNGHLARLPDAQRLALEMALHEADERRALEGELAELEQRWRDAEEIAAIADSLLLPASVTDRLARARGGA